MSRRTQYIKSKTDFVYRKKHSSTADGTIFENDHMTIVPEDGVYDEDVIMFSDSNFKFRVRSDINGKKKHFSGIWIPPSGASVEYWTEGDCSGVTTDESKIVLKPDYSSVRDFAYYGSATELMKATVRDIILRYPGGLCDAYEDYSKLISDLPSGATVVENYFGLDIWTPAESVEGTNDPFKVLSLSYDKYMLNGSPVTSFAITAGSGDTGCANKVATTTINGTTFITYRIRSGEYIVTGPTGVFLEPKPEYFKEKYDELDDFEKVLLTLDSKPQFTCELETPYFDGEGHYYTMKRYTWPSTSASTMQNYPMPHTSGPKLEGYLKALIHLAEYYDEYDCGNLWRMLTHQSIKNLDWTFFRQEDGDEQDLSDIDDTKIRGAIELYGRQFDDIRRYANNIKTTNAITYNEKNNTPDYFLTDCLENDGWDAYNVGPTVDRTVISNVIYSGTTYSGYTAADSNIGFIRRMILNSDYIQSLKGTKRGIEVILGMFGMSASDYTITEQFGIANRFPKSYEFKTCLPYYDNYYYGDDVLAEWPITEVTPPAEEPEGPQGPQGPQGGEPGDKYIIPWYDKNAIYGSGLYFQQFGGWEGMKDKSTKHLVSAMTTIEKINGDFIGLYGETLQYMKYAANLYELTGLTTDNLFENCVCYVEDITGIEDQYVANAEDSAKITDGFSGFSHYFILKTEELSTNIGYVSNDIFDCYGWRNVFTEEFDGSGDITCDGERVLYMETIKTTFIGNNPHVGYGSYDDGSSYVDHYNTLFKHEVEHGLFSRLDIEKEADILSAITSIGFDVDVVSSDAKCFYFENGKDSFMKCDNTNETPSDKDDEKTGEWGYPEFVSPEKKGQFDESAALSVINLKNINIDFATGSSEEYKTYIENVVLKYVEQMMPSTAIFSYTFSNGLRMGTPVSNLPNRNGQTFKIYGSTVTGLDGNLFVGGNKTDGAKYDPEII